MLNRYRTEYTGEFVVFNTLLIDGKYQETREWIPNTIINNAHNKVAVVLGDGPSRNVCDLKLLATHKRYKPELRLQTYGYNTLFRDYAPDFLVVNENDIVKELLQRTDLKKTTILSTAEIIMEHSKKFHLIPQNLNWSAASIAAYLACFDGHEKVYLLGFDTQNDDSATEKTERTMYTLFRSYPEVQFIRVNPRGPAPLSWQGCLNYRQISYREFVLEADL